jgi:hypothetical protein
VEPHLIRSIATCSAARPISTAGPSPARSGISAASVPVTAPPAASRRFSSSRVRPASGSSTAAADSATSAPLPGSSGDSVCSSSVASTSTVAWRVSVTAAATFHRSAARSSCVPWAAAGPDAHRAERNVEIIMGDEQLLQRDLVEIRQPLDRLTRQVHVGLRLGKDDLAAFVDAIGDNRLGLQLHAARAETDGQPVDQHEAEVVAIVAVFAAGIAEANEEEGVDSHDSSLINDGGA